MIVQNACMMRKHQLDGGSATPPGALTSPAGRASTDSSSSSGSPQPGPSASPPSSSQQTQQQPAGAAKKSGASSGAIAKEKTICTVCEIESDNHHVHYGALACFSCRAFFRRAHNKGPGPPGYACKKEGKCDITAKNRKKCQRCRYDKCVAMGMNSSLVLTDDQKKVRFRKMLEKKGAMSLGRKAASANSSDEVESGGEEDGGGEREKKRSTGTFPFSGSVSSRGESSSSIGSSLNRGGTFVPPHFSHGMSHRPFQPQGMLGLPGYYPPGFPSPLVHPQFQHHFNQQVMSGMGQMSAAASNPFGDPSSAAAAMSMMYRQHFGAHAHKYGAIAGGQGGGGGHHLFGGSSSMPSFSSAGNDIAGSLPSSGTSSSSSGIAAQGGSDPQPCSSNQGLLTEDQMKREILPNVEMTQDSSSAEDLFQQLGEIYNSISGGLAEQKSTTSTMNQNTSKDNSATTVQALRDLLEGRAQAKSAGMNDDDMNDLEQCIESSLEDILGSSLKSSSSSSEQQQGNVGANAPTKGGNWCMNQSNFSAMVKAYEFALSSVTLNPEAFEHVLACYAYGGEGGAGAISQSDLAGVVKMLGDQFRTFAAHVAPFQALKEADRRILVRSNTTRYVQYMLARFFSSQTGNEQLFWLLGDDVPISLSHSTLAKIGLASANRTLRLFSNNSDLTTYMNLTKDISQLGLSCIHNPLVAATLLFVQTEGMALEEGPRVQAIFEDIIEFVCDPGMAVSNIKRDTLEKVVDMVNVVNDFYAKNFVRDLRLSPSPVAAPPAKSPESGERKREIKREPDEDGEDDGVLALKREKRQLMAVVAGKPRHLEMPFTIEEDAWLSSQLGKFASAYDEVSLGEDFVNEFIMFSYDVPLSKRFIPIELSTFHERTRRILKSHPEFEELPGAVQSELVRSNAHKAVALASIKAESCATGIEQLKFCFGEQDRNNWRDNTSPLVNAKIKKVLITDWNGTTKAMDSGELISYLQLTGNLATSVEDKEMYQILSLISLFRNSAEKASAEAKAAVKTIEELEKKYQLLLQRKSRRDYSKIQSGLESVDELANIFEKLQTF